MLLRRLIHDGFPGVSKECAILDFSFDGECERHLIWQNSVTQGIATSTQPNHQVLHQYVSGVLPVGGIPWMKCNYLLIPSSTPVNNWYLYVVDMRGWKFQIYDCSHNIHTPDQLRQGAKSTFKLVQGLVVSSGMLHVRDELRKFSKKNMKMQIMAPCTNNG